MMLTRRPLKSPTPRLSRLGVPVPKLAALAFLALTGFAFLAFTGSAQAAPMLEPCHVDGVREAVRCGSVQVLEGAGGERHIDLRVVILPATQPDPLPDPLVILAGGPGQAASDLAGVIRTAFTDIHERREIVLIDQRGTGASNPLDCPADDEIAAFQSVAAPLEGIRTCLEGLEGKAELKSYSTYHAADDLERVRQAFEWPQINLWGGSYGSRLALVYQSRYPDKVRSMVIDAVAPYSLRLPLPNASSAQRAFDLLVADCASDHRCRGAFPDPAGDLAKILDELDTPEGQSLEIAHPRTGQELEIRLSRAAIAGAVRAILYDARRSALLPHMLRRGAEGDYSPLLAAALEVTSRTADMMHIGLTYSVLCSEDVARIDITEVDAATADTFLGRSEFDAFREICDLWPKTELPTSFEVLDPRQTPSLLLSGALDPVTPESWAEEALELLPNGRHLVAPGVGHITSFAGCAPKLISQFLDEASTLNLDATCLENLRRPPFVLSMAGPALESGDEK